MFVREKLRDRVFTVSIPQVTEGVVEAALSQAQAFWAKGVELQQVGRGAREIVEKRHVRR